jgi:general secretion pathway protein C
MPLEGGMDHHNQRMVARLSAFVIWALVGGTAMFWLLRLAASPLEAPPQTSSVSTSVAARGDLTRLLGAPPSAPVAVAAVPDAAGRFKLIGVMAPRSREAASTPGQGVALIAVDGKPARPYRVGAAIEGEFVLRSVAARSVTIGLATSTSAAPIVLELPPLPAPATGTLPTVSFTSTTVPTVAPAPAFQPPPPMMPPPSPMPAQVAPPGAAMVPPDPSTLPPPLGNGPPPGSEMPGVPTR